MQNIKLFSIFVYKMFIPLVWEMGTQYKIGRGVSIGSYRALAFFRRELGPFPDIRLTKTYISQGRSGLPCEFDADFWQPIPNQTLGDN